MIDRHGNVIIKSEIIDDRQMGFELNEKIQCHRTNSRRRKKIYQFWVMATNQIRCDLFEKFFNVFSCFTARFEISHTISQCELEEQRNKKKTRDQPAVTRWPRYSSTLRSSIRSILFATRYCRSRSKPAWRDNERLVHWKSPRGRTCSINWQKYSIKRNDSTLVTS